MNILFLCVANSARSQLAEALCRQMLGSKCQSIQSAGSAPTQIAQEAIEVLREIGVDASHQKSKSVSEINSQDVDLVITLCEEEACPVLLKTVRCQHWPMPDPARISNKKERMEEFRRLRDLITDRLKDFKKTLENS